MGRPVEWSPLADSDPVPGDPAGISSEAAHLAGIAQLIQGQIAQLRQIATGQSAERGRHVEKLQSAAAKTAGQLVKVAGRYQDTASALTAWVPALESAQSQSLRALAQAQEAVRRQQANQPLQRPSGTKLTPQEQQSDQARASALNQATGDLGAAQRLLQTAVSDRDQKAAETRARISHAIDDGVVDGFWDHVSAFIHEYAGLLTDIATALEWAATILAIAALFVSGIGFLLLAGLILAAGILRAILALNGDGSWSDVVLDGVALLTLGLGTGAGALLGKFAAGTADTAERMLQGERTLQELGAASKLADAPGGAALLNEGTTAGALEKALGAFEKSSPLQRFLEGGDLEKAAAWERVSYLTKLFPDSPVMQGIARDTTAFKGIARFSYLGGLAPDWGDKAAGGVQVYGLHSADQPALNWSYRPVSEPYHQWKDSWFPESSVWPK